MRVKPGREGRFFEDFIVGDECRHPLGPTLTQQDNIGVPLLTRTMAAVHFDAHCAAQTEFARPLLNSCLTLALVTGQSVIDVSDNVFANLGWDAVRLPHPVVEGDTIHSRPAVLDKREAKSRPNLGAVTVATEGFNQDAVVVCAFKRTPMVCKRGMAPNRAPPVPGSGP